MSPHQPALTGPAAASDEAHPARIASPCPVCGAYSLDPATQAGPLLSVCDVLVYKALEAVGKRLVRQSRERYQTLAPRPYYLAHLLWRAPENEVVRALRGAWDVVPAMLDTHGCCGVTSRQVTQMLDEYVHDLVITSTEHTLDELTYRFTDRLGLVP